MRLLLDTSVFIYLATEPAELSAAVRKAVDKAETRVLSVASAWEIAIKARIGKLTLPASSTEWVTSRARAMQVEIEAICVEHATQVEHLPFHHRDPFDRLLIAQAVVDNYTLVTQDRVFKEYAVRLIPAWN